MGKKKKNRTIKPRPVRKSVPKLPTLKNLGKVGQYQFVLLPGPNTQIGVFTWLDLPELDSTDQLLIPTFLDSFITLEEMCRKTPSQAQEFANFHAKVLTALGVEPEVLLGKHPRKRDFLALGEALDLSVAELECCEEEGLITDEDDTADLISWCAENFNEVGKCCGTYEHLQDLLNDNDTDELLNWLDNEDDPQAALDALMNETSSFLTEIFSHLENGHHHLTVNTGSGEPEVLTVEKDKDTLSIPEDIDSFAKKLTTAYTISGALIIRSVPGELHEDGLTKIVKIRGYHLGDQMVVPIDAAHIFDTCNIDATTGDILPPEHGVQYVDAWEIDGFSSIYNEEFELELVEGDEAESMARMLVENNISDVCFGWIPQNQWGKAHKVMPEYLEQFDRDYVQYNKVLQGHLEHIRDEALENGITLDLQVVPLYMDAYTTWCDQNDLDPDDSQSRIQYSVSHKDNSSTVSWPPKGVLAKCWCGSGKLYTSCCATV